MVVHNSRGVGVGSVTAEEDACSVAEAEIKAILWGLKLGVQLSSESDSSIAVNYLSRTMDQCPWAFRTLFVDIRSGMVAFDLWNIFYVNRVLNSFA